MADVCDITADRLELEEALAKKFKDQQKPAGPSLSECEECGDDIPKARQEAAKGCRLCVPCGNLADLRAKGVRRG